MKKLKYWTVITRLQRRRKPTKETLQFIGSSEAWKVVQHICENAHLEAAHITDISAVADTTTYLAFEITADGRPYDQLLWQLMANARNGHRSSVGTFNLQTNKLILPNDILC